MSFKILTPIEQRKLERSLRIVRSLARRETLSETNEFILRHRMRYVLVLLGATYVNGVLLFKGMEIIRDFWPFKIRRLRKIVNDRDARLTKPRRM